MKTSRPGGRLFVAALLLVCALACRPQQAPDGAAANEATATSPVEDRAAVEAAVTAHWAAINARDSALVDSHHTENLTIIATEVERRFAYASPDAEAFLAIVMPSTTRFRVEDVEVQLFGDVAVASFYLTGGVTRQDGTVDDRLRRVTEVWVRQPDGSWNEAHHHDSAFSPL